MLISVNSPRKCRTQYATHPFNMTPDDEQELNVRITRLKNANETRFSMEIFKKIVLTLQNISKIYVRM